MRKDRKEIYIGGKKNKNDGWRKEINLGGNIKEDKYEERGKSRGMKEWIYDVVEDGYKGKWDL